MTKAEERKVSQLRIVAAAILDFLTIFFLGGFIIARLTGNTTETGFQLNGLPAVVLYAVIIAYFVIGSKYAGGTIWQRIPKTRG